MPALETTANPRLAFTVDETCHALGISRFKFYEEVKARRLRALKSGRRTIVPVAAIDAWLSNLEPKAA